MTIVTQLSTLVVDFFHECPQCRTCLKGDPLVKKTHFSFESIKKQNGGELVISSSIF